MHHGVLGHLRLLVFARLVEFAGVADEILRFLERVGAFLEDRSRED